MAAQPETDTLTVSYHTAADLPAVEPLLLEIYAEVYAYEASVDPFFSVDRFADRLRRHASAPRWGCALGEVNGIAIGYAYGFARTATYEWGGLLTPVPADQLEESDTRTFALCEVMVRADWRGAGIARTLHEELLSHRIEERSHLLVEEDHPRVRALYERWGYTEMGTMQPYPDSPRYVSMWRPISL
ncbi:GNAT family N-acetyltransferase [Streptomyces sp. NRRL S-350]|uniref:GNAT family N-acetyltransferase n=1 Tax=Streptomyces sp. NRRL S-350 TaxID=1463902 RepID=UPI00068B435C|nr:GNAT family N-acetyltransferase [Streptomyces sp. NRRL S-350]